MEIVAQAKPPIDEYDLPAWNKYFRQMTKDADDFFGCGKTIDIINGDTGNIYFIQCQDTGPVKIGYAKSVKRRMYNLQVGCPYKLKLLLKVPGSKLWEEGLHKQFREFNMEGEWFLPAPKLMKHINNIRRIQHAKT